MGDIILLIIILIVLASVFGAFSSNDRPARSDSRQRTAARPRTVGSSGLRYAQSARMAMTRAGYANNPRYVQLTDLGLLAYDRIDKPQLVRLGDIVDNTRYLRPFAELWVPYECSGSVRLELIDQTGRLRYADDARYELGRGYNTVLPDTWLPLEGKVIEPGTWQLRVSANNNVLGVHEFGWRPARGSSLAQYIESDGELSPELAAALQQQQSRAMSLSELLGEE